MNSNTRFLFVFDFDLTIVDVNTDHKIFELIDPGLTDDLVY